MKPISDKPQGGTLLLRETTIGEYGILLADGKKITQSIYWKRREDMRSDLETILSEVTP